MAHRRGSSRRGISESQRRKKAWIGVKFATSGPGGSQALFMTSIRMATAATSANDGAIEDDLFILVSDPTTSVGDEVSTLPEECTILRARGSLIFPKNEPGAGASNIGSNYSFGFGVTDIRSLTNASAPGPITDVDWDGWMFLRQSAASVQSAFGSVVDVKAMRKIKTGDALFFAAQAVSGDSVVTPAGDWMFDMRLLVLLP